jgi:hypothetical protein
MQTFSLRPRHAMVILAAALTVILAGCPKHENFPTALDVVKAPKPQNFVITSLGRDTDTGWYDYDLSWSVSDPTHVDHYRLYLVGGTAAPELVEETPANTLPVALPFDAAGLLFGLSTVSTGFVESAMVVDTIPPLPTP